MWLLELCVVTPWLPFGVSWSTDPVGPAAAKAVCWLGSLHCPGPSRPASPLCRSCSAGCRRGMMTGHWRACHSCFGVTAGWGWACATRPGSGTFIYLLMHSFTHSFFHLLMSLSSSLTPWSLDNMGLFPALVFLSSRGKEGVW